LSPKVTIRAAVALLVGPIVFDLLTHDKQRVFAYLASDAYYYLTVAWNFAHLGVLGYDQSHASNGFHPLWQLVQCLLFLPRLPDTWMLYLVTLMAMGFLAAAFALLGRAMIRDGEISPLFVLLPLGILGLVLTPLYAHYIPPNPTYTMPMYGSTWILVDGMESCLTCFCFAAAAWLYVRGPEKTPLWFGLSLAALTLARLDHGFFAAMLFLGFLLRCKLSRPTLVAGLAFALPVGLYLLSNQLIFGYPLPLSGALKTTFPHLSRGNWERLGGWLKDPLKTSPFRMYRLAQMTLPLLAVPLPFLTLLWRKRDRFDEVLLLSAPAVVLLAGYDMWFVDLPAHGHWYFPVSALFMSLAVFRALGERPRGRLGWAVGAVAAATCLIVFFTINRRLDVNTNYARFYYEEGPKLVAHYRDNKPSILELDDGIIAFSTHFPCMSGSGLHLDREGFAAYLRRDLYSLAHARGFTRLASVMYMANFKLALDSPSFQIWSAFHSVVNGRDVQRFDFKVEYQSGEFVVARGDKK
jgi:hypothetical protein